MAAALGAIAACAPSAAAPPVPEPAAASAHAPAITRLVYAGDADFRPFEFLDEQGRPAGLNIDLIRAVAAARGLELQIELGPWGHVLPGIRSGRYDVAAMYRSSQRARDVDFTIPHELLYHEMFIPRGAPGLRTLNDLAGKRVLVQRGTYTADVLTDLGYGAELVPVESEPDAIRALVAGSGDVAVVTQTPGRPFQSRLALADRLVVSGPPVLLTEYAFVTRKGRTPLVDLLNDGVAAVKASGQYERIYERWIRPDRSAVLVQRIAWALAAALVLVAAGAVWMQSLRRRVAHQTEALRREFQERERAQAALAATEHSLRQAQKMESIGRLAGGVAHDFNNILTVILNYGTFLRDDLVARAMPTQDADEVLSATERAMRLTKQLLAFSRATPLEVTAIDLCALAREIRTMIQRLVGEDIDVDLAASDVPVIIDADLVQIEQIFLNLAANARDAMPAGGHLAISIRHHALPAGNAHALPPGDYAEIAVRDNGVGMDGATVSRIFDPFFTTKDVGRGTGLGLSTVFGNVAALRGKVSVESAPGAGSTFTVLLPRSPARSVGDASPPTARPVSGLAEGHTVLLVEDDEALRRAARLALEAAGYRILEARDGLEARERAAQGDPITLLVTDVVMPRLGGPQLVGALRQRQPHLRVLYMSGYVHRSQHLALEYPGTAFLSKPYAPHALVEAVDALALLPP